MNNNEVAWYTTACASLKERDEKEQAFAGLVEQVASLQNDLTTTASENTELSHRLVAYQTEALRAAVHDESKGEDWGHSDVVLQLRVENAALEESSGRVRVLLRQAQARLHDLHGTLAKCIRERDEAEEHRSAMLAEWTQHRERAEALQHLVWEKDKIILMLRDEIQACQLELSLKDQEGFGSMSIK